LRTLNECSKSTPNFEFTIFERIRMTLLEIAPENLLEVLKHLQDKDLVNLSQVNSYFYNLTTKEDYLWQVKFQEMFGHAEKPDTICWRNYYLKYQVVFTFRQGETPMINPNFNKTLILTAFISKWQIAFIDIYSQVWVTGFESDSYPIQLRMRATKVLPLQEDLIYLNMQNELCSLQKGVLVSDVLTFTDTYYLDLNGVLHVYWLEQHGFHSRKSLSEVRFKDVQGEYFLDFSNCLWNLSSIGFFLPVIENVLTYDVSGQRLAFIDLDQQLHIYSSFSELSPAPSIKFRSVSTSPTFTLAIDTDGQVWGFGDQAQAFEGIKAKFIATGHNYSMIIGRAV